MLMLDLSANNPVYKSFKDTQGLHVGTGRTVFSLYCRNPIRKLRVLSESVTARVKRTSFLLPLIHAREGEKS